MLGAVAGVKGLLKETQVLQKLLITRRSTLLCNLGKALHSYKLVDWNKRLEFIEKGLKKTVFILGKIEPNIPFHHNQFCKGDSLLSRANWLLPFSLSSPSIRT